MDCPIELIILMEVNLEWTNLRSSEIVGVFKSTNVDVGLIGCMP